MKNKGNKPNKKSIEKIANVKVNDKENKKFDDQIEGRNSVLELLESGKDINKIFVTRGEKHGSINKILAIAKERKIIVVEKDKMYNLMDAKGTLRINGFVLNSVYLTYDATSGKNSYFMTYGGNTNNIEERFRTSLSNS